MLEQYRILVQPQAAADLEAIHQFVSLDSPQNARSLVARLLAAFDSLQIFPTRHAVRQRRRGSSEVVRRMPVPPYLIYYRVRVDAKVVDIITVRHGARRQPQRLP